MQQWSVALIIVRTLLFIILVPGTTAVGVPYLLLKSGGGSFPFELGAFRLLGVVAVVVGVACFLWCAWEFAFAGRGTPALWDPPQHLVSRGLYRVVRNPIYIGGVLILIGEAVAFASLALVVYTVLMWWLFHFIVVLYEEPTLKETFGAVYEEYCKTVPRWIPRRRTKAPRYEKEGAEHNESRATSHNRTTR
jgi:protein-S-isoprenylcysteine O-methyltransferase Ste14